MSGFSAKRSPQTAIGVNGPIFYNQNTERDTEPSLVSTRRLPLLCQEAFWPTKDATAVMSNHHLYTHRLCNHCTSVVKPDPMLMSFFSFFPTCYWPFLAFSDSVEPESIVLHLNGKRGFNHSSMDTWDFGSYIEPDTNKEKLFILTEFLQAEWGQLDGHITLKVHFMRISDHHIAPRHYIHGTAVGDAHISGKTNARVFLVDSILFPLSSLDPSSFLRQIIFMIQQNSALTGVAGKPYSALDLEPLMVYAFFSPYILAARSFNHPVASLTDRVLWHSTPTKVDRFITSLPTLLYLPDQRSLHTWTRSGFRFVKNVHSGEPYLSPPLSFVPETPESQMASSTPQDCLPPPFDMLDDLPSMLQDNIPPPPTPDLDAPNPMRELFCEEDPADI